MNVAPLWLILFGPTMHWVQNAEFLNVAPSAPLWLIMFGPAMHAFRTPSNNKAFCYVVVLNLATHC